MSRSESAPAAEMLALRGVYDRAVTFSKAGNQAQAASLCRQILDRDPRNVSAMALLGQIALQAGHAGEAQSWFQKLVKAQPKEPIFRRLLAASSLRLGRPDEAEEEALAAYRLDAKSPETLRILFESYSALRKFDRALFFLEKALVLDPGNVERLRQHARLLELLGRADEARAALRDLVASGRADALCYYALALLEDRNAGSGLLAEIGGKLADNSGSPTDRAYLHQAAGRLDAAHGHDDAAFSHFEEAARLLPRTEQESLDARVEKARRIVTPAFLAERSSWGHASRRPVFVVGMPRSGTTLVEQILASHPKVFGAEEVRFFPDRVPDPARFDLPADEARGLSREYLKLLTALSKSAERVVDKMPHNFERLWLLALLFPHASFIHCRRDPLANCVSCFTNPLGGIHAYASDLRTLGAYYRSYRALMDHWQAVLPVRILDVDYEKLVADPEAESRRLVHHVGLEWNDACLRFNETKRVVTTPSRHQVTQPIYHASLDGWRRYGKHLAPLREALGDLAGPG